MCNVPDKDTIKSEIMHHLSVAKRGQVSKSNRAELFNAVFTSWKPLVNGRLLQRFHGAASVGHEQAAPQQLALVVASVRAYRSVAHSRVFTKHWFCLVFSKESNIVSVLSAHQSLSLPQKIDSREGLFWCKKGLVCACGRMNFYLNKPPLAPVLRLFAAKWSAFCR